MNGPLWRAEHLAIASGGRMEHGFGATGVSIDTRTLRAGDLFVALAGERRDGHLFVAEALARGAAGAMVSLIPDGLAPDAPLLRVDDTAEGLRRLGEFARGRFRGRLAAITGSVGKTTTKEMLARALAPSGSVHAAVASFNNHLGVPLTLANLPEDAGFAVIEIGMNHPGEIAPLSRLARPHVALITAIAKAHVGQMGGIEAIAEEKASILEGLEPGGVAVLPRDTPFLATLAARARGRQVVTFGRGGLAEARLIEAESDAEGCDLIARIAGAVVRLRLAAPGEHMAMDAVAALAVAAALGADVEKAAAALAGFAPLAGRGRQRRIACAGGEALLLDESYNASAASVRAALGVLALQPGRRIAVLGDMLELGDEAEEEHAGLAEAVAEAADFVFVCGPLMARLFALLPEEKCGAAAADAAALAPVVAEFVRAGDSVLVKGSLGSGMRQVVDALVGGRG